MSRSDDDGTTTGFKPHHLAIGLGLGIAVFTALSGIVPVITDWHNENSIHREVFGDVPAPLKVAFYTVIPTGSGCPAGYHPIYRSYNNRFNPDPAIRRSCCR